MNAEEQGSKNELNPDMSFMHTCKFCGTSKEYVKQLIIGPLTSICDLCVSDCQGLLADARDKGPLANLRMS